MIDNTHDRFLIWCTEGSSRKIVDYDDKTINDDNPLFGRINGDPRCLIALHVTPTKKSRKNKYGKETQYLLQGEGKVFWKNTTHVCFGFCGHICGQK